MRAGIRSMKSFYSAKATHWVQLRETEGKGKGLFAKKTIPANEKLCIGGTEKLPIRSIDDPSFIRAALADYAVRNADDLQTIFVPHNLDWIGWWHANHACFPNCHLASWDGGFLQTRRRIEADEELTVFYGGWREPKDNIKCLCAHPECLGWIRFNWPGTPNQDARNLAHLKKISPELTEDELRDRWGFL